MSVKHIKVLAIVEIVMGVLIIASFICPSPYSNVVLGAIVLGCGIPILIHAKKIK
jgi:uncharacterized membrane protein HdeD (DUF308 family)